MIAKAKNPFLLKLILLILTAFATLAPQGLAQSVERGEWEDILKLVSADVQKNFYDPQMKGLNWAKLTEETRERIKNSNNAGPMILAVSALLARLQDSHTYFVPPPLTAQADFGFSARAYAEEVRVYEITKKGPAEKAGLRVGDRCEIAACEIAGSVNTTTGGKLSLYNLTPLPPLTGLGNRGRLYVCFRTRSNVANGGRGKR